MPELAFISYRRSDAPHAARGLYAQLRSRFGPSRVFMDVGAITPGSPWPDRLRRSLDKTTLLLAVVGPGWLKATDEFGRRRLDFPDDWVRNEIERGIERRIPIVPVLVAGTTSLPPREGLPPSLVGLLGFQHLVLRDEKWDQDMTELIHTMTSEHGFVDAERRVVLPQPQVRMEPLTEDELDRALEQLPGWEPVETLVPGDYPKSRQEIRKMYRFKSFKKAIEFMQAAVKRINEIPHHPRWENQWRTLTVYLTTWDIGNRITQLDIQLARQLDQLYDGFASGKE